MYLFNFSPSFCVRIWFHGFNHQCKLLSITFRITLHWLEVSHEMHRSKCNYATITTLIYIFSIIKLHTRSSSAVQGGFIGTFVKIGNSFIQQGTWKYPSLYATTCFLHKSTFEGRNCFKYLIAHHTTTKSAEPSIFASQALLKCC